MITSPQVDARAFALRPVRTLVEANYFRFYEATTFPNNPYEGCELWLRRLEAVGYLVKDDGMLTLDVLDDRGDVIQEFPLSRRGLIWLRGRWKFKVLVPERYEPPEERRKEDAEF